MIIEIPCSLTLCFWELEEHGNENMAKLKNNRYVAMETTLFISTTRLERASSSTKITN